MPFLIKINCPGSLELIFNFNNRCKNEIADKDEKICSRFSDTVFHWIDFTDNGLHRDLPRAWELRIQLYGPIYCELESP